jgi:hypothetical protein
MATFNGSGRDYVELGELIWKEQHGTLSGKDLDYLQELLAVYEKWRVEQYWWMGREDLDA